MWITFLKSLVIAKKAVDKTVHNFYLLLLIIHRQLYHFS